MELETNQAMDGVDVITRVTKTRDEILSEIATAQSDVSLVVARLKTLEEIAALLPESQD